MSDEQSENSCPLQAVTDSHPPKKEHTKFSVSVIILALVLLINQQTLLLLPHRSPLIIEHSHNSTHSPLHPLTARCCCCCTVKASVGREVISRSPPPYIAPIVEDEEQDEAQDTPSADSVFSVTLRRTSRDETYVFIRPLHVCLPACLPVYLSSLSNAFFFSFSFCHVERLKDVRDLFNIQLL